VGAHVCKTVGVKEGVGAAVVAALVSCKNRVAEAYEEVAAALTAALCDCDRFGVLVWDRECAVDIVVVAATWLPSRRRDMGTMETTKPTTAITTATPYTVAAARFRRALWFIVMVERTPLF
jgi:hypothetical protein